MHQNKKILVVYCDKPTRSSAIDLLYCYERYSDAMCFYYSIRRGKIPSNLLRIKFDLIIFHTLFISERWLGINNLKNNIYPLINSLKNKNVVKIVLPQDEWIHTEALNDFINDFNVDIVYSVAPETEFKKIYNKVDFSKVKFQKVLTGYLDSDTTKKINHLESKSIKRDIDIGYRAFRAPAWLGSHGYLKTKIADVFEEESKKYNLKNSISTRESDTILGDKWYEFLLSCKYVIGVEGGSTVIDPYGFIWEKGTDYEKENPDASFNDFEKQCFPGMDGNLNLVAISPRHLEACSTKTCQILVEGDYNGVLKANIHYIELKKDFSNLQDVLNAVKDDKIRAKITIQAHNDIVLSDRYSYNNFVNFILTSSLKSSSHSKVTVLDKFAHKLNAKNEILFQKKRIYNEKMERNKKYFLFTIKSLPYTVLIKLGFTSLIKKRLKIKY